MKRILSLILALALLAGCVILPAGATAEGITSTSYSERFILGYSMTDGQSTGTSHAFRIYFKNTAKRDMVSWRVCMIFYQSNGTKVGQKNGEWQNTKIASGESTWSNFVGAPARADTFKWKLQYKLGREDKIYSTGWRSVALPKANAALTKRKAWQDVNLESVPDYSEFDKVLIPRYQDKYVFNVNSTTGVITKTARYRRDYIQNSWCPRVYKFTLAYSCYKSQGGKYLDCIRTTSSCKLRSGDAQWSKWTRIPVKAGYVSVYLTFESNRK